MAKRDAAPGGFDISGLDDVLEKRSHRATGKPRGGKREGAGKPKGAKSALPSGAVAALRTARLRVPDDASPEAAELAGEALQRIVDVMREEVGSFSAFSVLTAARAVREEICGPLKQKVEHTGADGGPLVVNVVVQEPEEGIVIEAADA